MNNPFASLKVLELASVLAGPLTGMFFAELGATVTKVEHPHGGDVTRGWHHPKEQESTTTPAYFCSANWGKQSVVLDFNDDENMQRVQKLICDSDIVLTSFKFGDAEKFRLSAGEIQRLNPQAIVASVFGFSPTSSRVAYDAVIQAESGFMSMNGTPQSGPVKMPVALIDVLTSHHLREAILVQLISGDRTPIQVSLLDVAVCSLVNQASNYLMTGQVPSRLGTEHPNICPYGMVFTTGNHEQVLLACGSERQVELVLQFFKATELLKDARCCTNAARVSNREWVRETLQSLFANTTSEEFMEFALRNAIPAGQIRSLDQVFASDGLEPLMLSNGQFKAVSTIASNISRVQVSPPPILPAKD